MTSLQISRSEERRKDYTQPYDLHWQVRRNTFLFFRTQTISERLHAMTTGMKIIEIVLASLSLALKVIESYHKVLKSIKDYLKYENTLASLQTRLRLQKALYQETMTRLLLSKISEAEMMIYFSNLQLSENMKIWKNPKTQLKLRRRLNNLYDAFMSVNETMGRNMTILMKKLKIDIQSKIKKISVSKRYCLTYLLLQPSWIHPATANFQSRERLAYEWRKIRRSFDRRERQKLIDEFERYNQNIASLVDQRKILTPLIECKPQSYLTSYNRIKFYACDLFEMMQTRWKCDCCKPRSAKLRLTTLNPCPQFPSFEVLISFNHRSEKDHQNPDQKMWHKTRLDVDELDVMFEKLAAKSHSIQTLNMPTSQLPTSATSNSKAQSICDKHHDSIVSIKQRTFKPTFWFPTFLRVNAQFLWQIYQVLKISDLTYQHNVLVKSSKMFRRDLNVLKFLKMKKLSKSSSKLSFRYQRRSLFPSLRCSRLRICKVINVNYLDAKDLRLSWLWHPTFYNCTNHHDSTRFEIKKIFTSSLMIWIETIVHWSIILTSLVPLHRQQAMMSHQSESPIIKNIRNVLSPTKPYFAWSLYLSSFVSIRRWRTFLSQTHTLMPLNRTLSMTPIRLLLTIWTRF